MKSSAPRSRAWRAPGYGVVLPALEEMELCAPEIARDGAHFGVRLRANAPSLHLIQVDLNTNVSPIVGTEKQSRELVEHLAAEYKRDPSGVWATEVFGKPLRDLVRDEMGMKLAHLPGRRARKAAAVHREGRQRGHGRHDLHPIVKENVISRACARRKSCIIASGEREE